MSKNKKGKYCGVRKETAIWEWELRLCARFKAGRFQITQTARTRICIRHVLAGSGIRGHSCPAHIQSKYKVAIADGIGISNSVNSTQGIMHTECRVLPFLCHYISLPHAS